MIQVVAQIPAAVQAADPILVIKHPQILEQILAQILVQTPEQTPGQIQALAVDLNRHQTQVGLTIHQTQETTRIQTPLQHLGTRHLAHSSQQ